MDDAAETDQGHRDRVRFGPHAQGGDVVFGLEVERGAADLAGALSARASRTRPSSVSSMIRPVTVERFSPVVAPSWARESAPREWRSDRTDARFC